MKLVTFLPKHQDKFCDEQSAVDHYSQFIFFLITKHVTREAISYPKALSEDPSETLWHSQLKRKTKQIVGKCMEREMKQHIKVIQDALHAGTRAAAQDKGREPQGGPACTRGPHRRHFPPRQEL